MNTRRAVRRRAASVPLEDASTRIDASTVPMHGAAHTANAPPSSAREPLPCARRRSPGATARSGHGRTPRNARPSTTRTKPAILTCDRLSTVLPTAAAAAPRRTNTAVKPITNGTLATTMRLETPRSPRRSTSTAETAERYPGTRGRTHGVTTERRPARNAIGSFSIIEPLELLVDAALDLRVEAALEGGGAGRAGARDQWRAPNPSATTPASAPPSGNSHARRSNPCFAGVERTPGPKFRTISSRICCSVQP